MIIGIDYTAAVWQGAGIGRYTRELFAATIPRDRSLHYRLFYAAHGLPADSPYLHALADLCATNPNVQVRPIPITPRLLTILWQRLRLPLHVEHWLGKVDILHAPDFVLPPTRARTLLTVHDLTFMVRPETADARLRRYLEVAVPRSLRRADLILADSQATRDDLQRLLGVAPERVHVLYPGVNPRFHPLPASEIEPIRTQLGLPATFLLFVGTLEPRKNLVRLIEAFHLLNHPDLHLVIAGRRGWLYEEIFTTVNRLGLGERVRFLDFVDDAHLPAVYNLARVCVYPSLYEGFGLPVLEALACGTPVVTANVSSLPEVVGTAAILVDPHDPQAIATGIQQALSNSAVMRRAGPPQAATFRWGTAAERLIDMYYALATPRL